MAQGKRLIDANAVEAKIEKNFRKLIANQNSPQLAAALSYVGDLIIEAPTVAAVEVARIEEVKQEILQTLDTLIATHRNISNSQFSEFEKHLDIPKSSNDYYGIYADVMEIARRAVNAALTDLCENCGARMDGGNEIVQDDR